MKIGVHREATKDTKAGNILLFKASYYYCLRIFVACANFPMTTDTLAMLYKEFDLTTMIAKSTKLKDRKIIFWGRGFKHLRELRALRR